MPSFNHFYAIILLLFWSSFSNSVALESKKLAPSPYGHFDQILAMAFNTDGSKVITAREDYVAKVWNIDKKKLLMDLQHSNTVWSAEFSADGSRILTTSDRRAYLWRADDGRLLQTLKSDGFSGLSPDGLKIFTTDSRVIVSGINSMGLIIGESLFEYSGKIWNAKTGELLIILNGHNASIVFAQFSPDSSIIVTSSNDNTTKIWSALNGELIYTLDEGRHAKFFSFSPDGSKIVASSINNKAIIWDVKNGRPLASLEGHKDVIMNARFSPDGTKIVTSSEDRTAKIWDLANGKLLFTFPMRYKRCPASFSPDSKKVVTPNMDFAQIWDANDGHLLYILPEDGRFVRTAIFSPNGQIVATESVDKIPKLWKLPPSPEEAVQGYGLKVSPCNQICSQL